MVKKFKLIFLISIMFLIVFGTTSFAKIEMTSGDADQILNYYQENLDTMFQSSYIMASIKTNLSKVDRQAFADTFNDYFYKTNGFIDKVSGDYDFNNVTCFAYYYKTGSTSNPSYYVYFFFVLSNNTFSSELDYLYYETKTNNTDKNSIGVCGWDGAERKSLPALKIVINYGTSIQSSSIIDFNLYSNSVTTTDFPEVEGAKVDIKSFLGLSPVQTIYYKPYGADKPEPYFLANTIDLRKNLPEIPDTPESGDTEESGDTGGGTTTPSGDNGSGTTTDEKLDNINQNLNNIENVIASGNQEIVGEIGEVKDFLSGDATITDNELLEKFPEVEIEDPSEDFFSWIFSQIENVFLSTEPQSFEFSLFTENKYSVSSEQIKVPDNAIKTLVGLSTAFGIFYWILKDVRKTINKIKEGSIEALATEDITADMV